MGGAVGGGAEGKFGRGVVSVVEGALRQRKEVDTERCSFRTTRVVVGAVYLCQMSLWFVLSVQTTFFRLKGQRESQRIFS